jgi:hypothetical protein
MDSILGRGGSDKYVVVARKPSGVAAPQPDEIDDGEWQWHDNAPDKDNFQYEYGELLDPGVRYLCVEVEEQGYSLDDPQWEIKATRKPDPVEKKVDQINEEVQEMKEGGMADAATELNLADVEDQQQLQARMQGALAARGLQVAEDIEDVKELMDAVTHSPEPTGNPMMDMMTGASNNLEINDPKDLMIMMTLPEVKEVVSEGREAVSGINDLLDSGSAGATAASALLGGSGGGGSDDEVTLSRDEFEQLVEKAESGGSAQPQAEAEAETAPPAEVEDQEDDSFDLRDYEPDDGGAEGAEIGEREEDVEFEVVEDDSEEDVSEEADPDESENIEEEPTAEQTDTEETTEQEA